MLAGRFAAAATVTGLYVIVVFLATAAITAAFSGWWPDRTSLPALELAAAVAVLSALSLAGSVLLSANANGIAVFMLFGAGLTAGLLGQIGEALGSRTLDRVADIVSWVLPFEALYQAALAAITSDTVGFTRLAINLGPFGGAEEAGPLLWPWTVALPGAGRRGRLGRLRAPRPVSDESRRADDLERLDRLIRETLPELEAHRLDYGPFAPHRYDRPRGARRYRISEASASTAVIAHRLARCRFGRPAASVDARRAVPLGARSI